MAWWHFYSRCIVPHDYRYPQPHRENAHYSIIGTYNPQSMVVQ
jgi:hypothetical protein